MSQKGFTLVEVLLVVALIAVAAVIVMPYMGLFAARQQLDAVTDEVIGNLRRAQNKAIIGEENDQWGIHWRSLDYVVFKGSSFTAVGSTDEVYDLPENISISAFDVVFDRLTGKASATTITVILTTVNEQKQISINEQGKIQLL